MKLLSGEKVWLRAIEPKDLDLLMNWENDTANWEVSGTVAPFSRALLKKYVENAHLDIYQAGQLRLMVVEKKTGQTIGTVDIFDFDAFHLRAGLGVLIADDDKRKNGYGLESVQLVCKYCFAHLGLNQLYCNILAENKISQRLFEKAGFKVTGTKKQWHRTNGGFRDQLFLQLLKET